MNVTNPNTMTNLIYDVLKSNSERRKGKMYPADVLLNVASKVRYGTIDERFVHLYTRALSILRSQGSVVYSEDGTKIGLSRSALREGF